MFIWIRFMYSECFAILRIVVIRLSIDALNRPNFVKPYMSQVPSCVLWLSRERIYVQSVTINMVVLSALKDNQYSLGFLSWSCSSCWLSTREVISEQPVPYAESLVFPLCMLSFAGHNHDQHEAGVLAWGLLWTRYHFMSTNIRLMTISQERRYLLRSEWEITENILRVTLTLFLHWTIKPFHLPRFAVMD